MWQGRTHFILLITGVLSLLPAFVSSAECDQRLRDLALQAIDQIKAQVSPSTGDVGSKSRPRDSRKTVSIGSHNGHFTEREIRIATTRLKALRDSLSNPSSEIIVQKFAGEQAISQIPLNRTMGSALTVTASLTYLSAALILKRLAPTIQNSMLTYVLIVGSFFTGGALVLTSIVTLASPESNSSPRLMDRVSPSNLNNFLKRAQAMAPRANQFDGYWLFRGARDWRTGQNKNQIYFVDPKNKQPVVIYTTEHQSPKNEKKTPKISFVNARSHLTPSKVIIAKGWKRGSSIIGFLDSRNSVVQALYFKPNSANPTANGDLTVETIDYPDLRNGHLLDLPPTITTEDLMRFKSQGFNENGFDPLGHISH